MSLRSFRRGVSSPGCKIMYYDSTDCSGSAMYTVDATSSAVAVTVNKQLGLRECRFAWACERFVEYWRGSF